MRRAEEMRALFAQFEESGLTMKGFGEREGISYTTLQYWRRKLRGLEDANKTVGVRRKAEPVALSPVRIVSLICGSHSTRWQPWWSR